MIVAALIATVTFAAGFTLPGGYIQNESNNQGLAVLSLPTNGTNGKDRYMAFAVRENFESFVMEDSIAMVFSVCYWYLFPCRSPQESQEHPRGILILRLYTNHGCDDFNGVCICRGLGSCALFV